MGIVLQFAQRMPASVLVRLGRLRYTSPRLRPLLDWASRPLQRGEATIRQGMGRGLRFDPSGGNPGYAVGAVAMAEQQLLGRMLKPGQTFYDIGANVGFFAVIGAKLVGPGGRVYAFEPFPNSVAAIRANAARNAFSNVTVVEAAVGRTSGDGMFRLDGASAEFGLIPRGQPAPADALRVSVVCVDDLVLGHTPLAPPDVIMIDVEGGEIDVLHGMARTIARHQPIIVCEVHGRVVEFANACAEVCKGLGYRITQLDGSPLSQDPHTRCHVLMLPRLAAS